MRRFGGLPALRLTRSLSRSCAALTLLALLAGCSTRGVWSYPPQVRGNQVDPDAMAQLVPGTATKADVTALFGSPTMKATFDDNTWLYISEVTRPRIFGTQSVLDQDVIAITFDAKGTVATITRKTAADSLPVSVVARTTPSPGTDATFLQQLLGNIGRYGPGFNSGGSSSSGNY
jgi:outer membrane protein assembly factor BamE (lipoprotein component of BamABCDE complex)